MNVRVFIFEKIIFKYGNENKNKDKMKKNINRAMFRITPVLIE
jgi:hypothetical protein